MFIGKISLVYMFIGKISIKIEFLFIFFGRSFYTSCLKNKRNKRNKRTKKRGEWTEELFFPCSGFFIKPQSTQSQRSSIYIIFFISPGSAFADIFKEPVD